MERHCSYIALIACIVLTWIWMRHIQYIRLITTPKLAQKINSAANQMRISKSKGNQGCYQILHVTAQLLWCTCIFVFLLYFHWDLCIINYFCLNEGSSTQEIILSWLLHKQHNSNWYCILWQSHLHRSSLIKSSKTDFSVCAGRDRPQHQQLTPCPPCEQLVCGFFACMPNSVNSKGCDTGPYRTNLKASQFCRHL